jgi:hypothetical protein
MPNNNPLSWDTPIAWNETVFPVSRPPARPRVMPEIAECARCNGEFYTEHMEHVEDEGMVCSRCLRSDIRQYDGSLAEYHLLNPTHLGFFTGQGPTQRAKQGVRYFGVELEYEVRGADYPSEESHDVWSRFGRGRCIISDDGSLDQGLELVTAPADYCTMRSWLERFTPPDSCRAMSTCGMHVHVSRNTISHLTLGKLLVFVNNPANDNLMTTIARRGSTTYCKKHEKKFKYQHLQGFDRYQAINTARTDTIEFRIFASTRTAWKMCAALEAVQALISFCEATSCRALDELDFLLWLRRHQSQYKMLAKLILRSQGGGRGILKPPKAKPTNLTTQKEAANACA